MVRHPRTSLRTIVVRRRRADQGGELIARIMHLRFLLNFVILGAALTRRVTLGAEAPAITLGNQFTVLVVEFAAINLLDRAAGEAGLMLDQVLEPGLGVELVAKHYRLMPGHIDAREHRMHSGQATDVAAERPVQRKNEGG